MALPYLKETFYLPFYFQHMQWRPCTVLNFAFACHRHSQQFIGSHGRGYSDAGKMQQALNIQINAKAIHFQTCYFFYKIVASKKQLLTPVLRFNNCQATKSGSTSRLESVISSLLVVLMRIFFKETTCIIPPGSWESSYSQLGGGGGGGEGLGKVDIEKRLNR